MKRILMLNSVNCGSGDTKINKIYDILDDIWCICNEEREDDCYPYTKDNVEKYPNGHRFITIKDESSEDNFEIYENDTRLIIFETDKELAHELINRIEGLSTTIVNMAIHFNK